MPQQFLVPQFIEVEDKIISFITVRQFVIMIIAVLIGALEYRLLSFIFFIPAVVLTVGLAAILAFVKINGRPVHFFLLNFAQTLKRPKVRIWNKESYVHGVTEIREEKGEIVEKAPLKKAVSGSRLHDMALVINTGGVYKGEDEFYEDSDLFLDDVDKMSDKERIIEDLNQKKV